MARPIALASHGRTLPRLFAGAALLALAACTAVPSSDTAPFPSVAAGNTFSAGYRQIAERYINAIPASKVAIAGLGGIAALDDSLTIRREDDKIVLAQNGGDTRYFRAPDDDDALGWADLTVEVSLAGREMSDKLRRTPVETLYQSVFDSALADLDRFSRYSGAKRAMENRARRRGFGGVGIQVHWSEAGATVARVLANSPAAKAGLRVEDVITHVDGVRVSRDKSGQFLDNLRGPIDSPVSLTVVRDREAAPLHLFMKRARIFIPTVSAKIEDDIIYVALSGFNNRTSSELANKFREADRELDGRARGVVIDLRGNPGGLLKQAIRVADLFLVNGRIVATRGRHPDSVHDYDARGTDVTHGLPIVVIVNGKSASSAEIVAAALQDQDRAVVIGTTSFGKGTVQTVARLPNNGEMTLTWSRFITPSGYFLHRLGVLPVVCTNKAGDAGHLIADAVTGVYDARHQIVAWRSVAADDYATRGELRHLCPSSYENREVDTEVARLLIDDPVLYRRMIALAPSVASAAR